MAGVLKPREWGELHCPRSSLSCNIDTAIFSVVDKTCFPKSVDPVLEAHCCELYRHAFSLQILSVLSGPKQAGIGSWTRCLTPESLHREFTELCAAI